MQEVAVQVFEAKSLPSLCHVVCKCTDEVIDAYVRPGLSLLIDDFAGSFSESLTAMPIPFSSKTLLEVLGLVQEGQWARGDEDVLSCLDFFQFEKSAVEEVRWKILDPTYYRLHWKEYGEAITAALGQERLVPDMLVGSIALKNEMFYARMVFSLRKKLFHETRWDLIVSDTHRWETLLYRFIGAPETLHLDDLAQLSIYRLSYEQAYYLGTLIKNMEFHMVTLLLSLIEIRPLKEAVRFVQWATLHHGWSHREYYRSNGRISMDRMAMTLQDTTIHQGSLKQIKRIGKALRDKGLEGDLVWPGAQLTWSKMNALIKEKNKRKRL